MHPSEPGLVLPFLLALGAVVLAGAFLSSRGVRRLRLQLAAERQRTELVIRATQTGIFDWDVASNRIDYSERFKEILGFPLNADLSDRTRHFDNVHPEDRERAREAFVAHLREGRDSRTENLHAPIEYRLRRADGGYTWVRGTGLSLRAPDGRTTRYIASIIDISERKRRDIELANQVKFVQDLFELVPLSLSFRDVEGRYQVVNRTWERYFRGSRDQVIGKTLHELMPAELADSIEAEHRAVFDRGAGGPTGQFELALRGRRYIQTRTAMADASGKTIGVLLTANDITEQYEIQRVLETQRQRLALVVRASKAGIIDWDPATNVTWYSDGFKELLRHPPEVDTSGWTLSGTAHPDDWPALRGALVANLKGESGSDSFGIEYRLRCADGSYIWVHGMGLVLRNADGRATRFLASVSDITERRAQENAQREQEQRLALVVRASQAGIIDWDGVTRRGWYSDRFKELLGYPADADTTSWTFFDHVHADDREGERADLIAHLKGTDPATRESLMREFRMLRADGSTIWVQSMGLSLRDENGRSARFLAAVTDISARRAQEQALREQVELTRDLIRALPNPLFLKDENFRFVHVNPGWEKMSGIPAEKAVGGLVHEVYPPQFAEDFARQDAELLAEPSGTHSMEITIPGRKKTRHYILAKALLRRADGSLRGMVGSCTDITRIKEIEVTLRNQIKLTRDLIDGNPNPVYLKDDQCRFLEINTAYSNLTRVTPEQAIGRTVFDLYQTERAAMFDRQDRELLARGEGSSAIEVDYEFPEKRRYFLMSKTILKRADGTVHGLVGTLTDITQIKEIEAQLRESEERMRFWLENIPIPIAIYDPEGGVQYLNSAFVATFGWTLEEMRGKRMPFVPEARGEQLTEVLRNLLTVGKDAFETERMTKNGRVLDIFISTGMARAADGTPRATMVSLMDVTERKRMERELSASREEALQAAQAKAAFLASMSHEIRTPLNGVLGMAGLLEGTELTPEQREYLETIQVSGDALLAVINDILDYSKIESGRMELERMPIEPVRAIEESLEILGARARAKGLELIAEIADGMPQWVLGDLARLRQVLVNLVSNAVKFTDAGEVVVEARASTPGVLEFAVRDTGIGIPKERIGALFEAFSQVDVSTTRKYGGTGLGLAISRRLVEFMGGELRVESEPGRGSTFSFTVRAQPCAPSATLHPATATANALRGKRLLVVDDNVTNRRILARQLERWGATPVAVDSAAAALERLGARRSFDAALFDYHMPGMDGVMLAREVRRRGLKLPIVLLSSSMYRRAEEAEADLFAAQLLKPIRQQQLQAAIAAAIAGEHFDPGHVRRAAPEDRGLAERLPLRILVADDVDTNRRLAVALLRNLGYAADAVDSGKEAIEAAAAGKYDLVLMDVQMPDVDGLEATRQIRRRMGERRPRVVALTASAMAGDRERCLAAGMDDYLSKPLQPQALRAVLEQVGRSAASQAGRQRAARPAGAIDWSRIESLKPFDPDGSMVAGVIASFLADAPGRIRAIRKAHASGDAASLASAAHALKGAAANIGAARLLEASQAIESLAREGRMEDAGKPIGGLEKSLAAARTALAAQRRKKPSRGS